MGVPVLFLSSLFEGPEVKDLLAILSLLVDARATGVSAVCTAFLPRGAMVRLETLTPDGRHIDVERAAALLQLKVVQAVRLKPARRHCYPAGPTRDGSEDDLRAE